MAVKVKKRTYSELYDPITETDWLLGNVGDLQKLLLEVEVSIEFQASNQEPVQIDRINNAFILSNGNSWSDYGFDSGMSIVFQYKVSFDTDSDGNIDSETSYQQTFEILQVYGDTIVVDEVINVEEFDNLPTNFGNKKATDVLFYGQTPPEGCRIRYSHFSNENISDNLNSVIDGSTTEFIFPGLQNLQLGSWAEMEAIGLQSGMAIKKVRVRYYSGDENTVFSVLQSSNLDVKSISTDQVRVARSIPIFGIVNSSEGFTTATGTSGMPVNNDGYYQDNANNNQAFLLNSNVGEITRDFYFNIDLRITDVNGGRPEDSFNLVLFKYTQGTSVFVERIVLQSYNDPQQFINRNLNYTGIKTLNLNDGDSLILAAEYSIPEDRQGGQGASYKIENVFIQASNKNEKITLGYKKKYQFEIEFFIASFLEGIENFINQEAPDFLIGENSLTDNFLTTFYPEWNNPNVKIENDLKETRRLGNTGWFNENFNELENNFSVDSIEYFDLNGNQVESLDYSQSIKVKAVISGVSNLSNQTECGIGFAWIPENPEDYKNKEVPLHRNLLFQTGDNTQGMFLNQTYNETFYGFGFDGVAMNLHTVKFSEQNDKIVFEGVFEPTSAFYSFFNQKEDSNRNYILWFSVADRTLDWNFSDRVSLLADFNSLVESIPPAGVYDELNNNFIEHPFEADNVGVQVYKGFVQDDVLARMPFRIPKNGSIDFQAMTFGYEAYNLSNDESFTLEEVEVNVSDYPIDSNGAKQINFNDTRGFKMNQGNNKNWIKINKNDELDTVDYFGYMAYFSSKIRYEDWLLNQDAPGIFYDASQLNDGLNNDWFNYLQTEGWKIYLFVIITAIEGGELVEYKNRYEVTFKDYDSNNLLIKKHQYYRHSDNTLLNVGEDPVTGKPLGVILQNEPTRIEISYTIQDNGIWDLNNTYAIITIEIDNGAGRIEQRQLSSVWGSENDNPLKPLEGYNKLKMDVDGTAKLLTTSCLVDPDLLQDGSRYRITGRVGCFDNSGDGGFDPGLYEFRYEETYQ